MAVQADERPPAVAQQGEQLAVAEAVDARAPPPDRRRRDRQVDAEIGQRACAAGRRATRHGAAGRAGGDRAGAGGRRRGAVDAEHGRGRRRPGRRRRPRAGCGAGRRRAPCRSAPAPRAGRRAAASSHRSCSSVDRASGNDSATGPGPNTVPVVGGSVVIGRACSRCSSPSWSTAHSTSCGPPYVRAASAGEPGEAAQDRCRGALGVRRADLAHPAAAVEDTRPTVDLAGHELVGTAGDGGDDDAVAPAGDGIGAEEHAAPLRPRSIGWTRMAMSASTRPARRARSAEREHDRRGRRAGRLRRRRRGSTRTRRPSTTPRRPRPSTTSARRRAPSPGGTRRATPSTAASRSCCDQRGRQHDAGRAGRPALRARARFAAFAPTRSGRPAAGSSSVTTAGGAMVSTEGTVALHA